MTDRLVEFPTKFARSPGERRRVMALWRTNEEFRCLCQELRLARSAERYWSGQTTPEAGARRVEYHLLREELELEVRKRLERNA